MDIWEDIIYSTAEMQHSSSLSGKLSRQSRVLGVQNNVKESTTKYHIDRRNEPRTMGTFQTLVPALILRGCQRYLIKFSVKSFLFSSPVHRTTVFLVNYSNIKSCTTFSFSCCPCEISLVSCETWHLSICYAYNIAQLILTLKPQLVEPCLSNTDSKSDA